MDKEVLEKVLSGLADRNIRFDDMKRMVADFGFDCRIKGDYYIYSKEDISEIINLQPLKDGKAKPYQVKQVRNLILKYKLHKEAKDV